MDRPATFWDEIRVRFEAGDSARSIAADMTASGHPITHQGILKRANKDNWTVSAGLARIRAAAKLPEPLTPEMEQSILADIAVGLPREIAAARAMTNARSIVAWEYARPDFGQKLNKAEADFFAARIADLVKASEAGNADASLFLANLSALTEQDRQQIAATALHRAA